MNTILVLDDGEIFSCTGDSRILWVTDAGMALLDAGLEPNALEDVFVKQCVYISTLPAWLHNEKIKKAMP